MDQIFKKVLINTFNQNFEIKFIFNLLLKTFLDLHTSFSRKK